MRLEAKILGPPFAWQRAAPTKRGARTPEAMRRAKRRIAHDVAAQDKPAEPTRAPVRVVIWFGMGPPPPSWPKLKRQRALSGELPHTNVPDIDNLTKTILDALNGVWWHDDRQVYLLTAEKIYSTEPYTTIVAVFEE